MSVIGPAVISTSAPGGTGDAVSLAPSGNAHDFLSLLGLSLSNPGMPSANNAGNSLLSLAAQDERPVPSREEAPSAQPDRPVTHVTINPPVMPQHIAKVVEQATAPSRTPEGGAREGDTKPHAVAPAGHAGDNHSDKASADSAASAASADKTAGSQDDNGNQDGAPSVQEKANSGPVSSGDPADDALQPQKKLQSSLQDELGKIDQLLSAIIQLLIPVPAASAPQATSASTDAGGVVPAGSVPAAAGQNVPAINAPKAADELALLQDIQSVIEQMQQLLQGNNAVVDPGAPVMMQAQVLPQVQLLPQVQVLPQAQLLPPAVGDMGGDITAAAVLPLQGPQDILPTINMPLDSNEQGNAPVPADMLQGALAELTGLLAKLNSIAGAKAGEAAAAPQAQDQQPAMQMDVQPDMQAGDVISLIKSGIASIRQQLQVLKGQNEAVFSRLQDNHSFTADATQLFKDILAANGFALKDDMSHLPVSYASAVASQTQDAMPPQVPVNNQNTVAVTAGLSPIQQNFDNPDPDSNGQGQPQAAPVTTVGAGLPQSPTDASGASFSRLMQQQDAQPLLAQVAFQIKNAMGNGSSKITIQLHPADLGKLDIRISVDSDGKASVAVMADNHHTLDLLQRDAQGLSRALADAGLKADSGSLSFSLGGGQNQNQQDNQQGGAHSVEAYQQVQPDDEQDEVLAVVSQSYVMNVAEGLDIRI